MNTKKCDDPKCPSSHNEKLAQEKLREKLRSVEASLALRRPDNVPPQANYRYNPPDRTHSTSAVYNSGPTGAQSRPNPTRPAATGYRAFQTRPTAQHQPRPQPRPKIQLHGKKHQSRLPEHRIVNNVFEDLHIAMTTASVTSSRTTSPVSGASYPSYTSSKSATLAWT